MHTSCAIAGGRPSSNAETHTEIDAGRQLARLRQAWLGQFDGYQPQASLLHGDLWSGNVATLGRDEHRDEGVVFDPAVHYGDRECDLAMADLFGGFDAGFFAAYQGHWPLQRGWRERRRFYQLYHLLNHANLFGGHYVGICRKLIDQLGE
ncbi:MAG: fructosamine kinase family protein [Xanthomonadaceae bacterium]|nr:fructosamine kinase family protein [Xanthomonadaceae bacterium]